MIHIEDLKKFHGGQLVLKGIRLTVEKGEVAAIIGPSGGGKSTLLRCINGLEVFEEGSVRIRQIELRPGKVPPALLRDLRQQVGMVFQQFHLFPHLNVLENVLSGPLWAQGRAREECEAEAMSLLDLVGMRDKAKARPDTLSGGQQQRVAIARALAVKPEAILFDEPTSALDPRMAGEVLAVMTDLARQGQTMIVVTHAMNFARRVANQVHIMHDGVVAESGPPDQVFAQPTSEAARRFLKALESG